MLTEEQASKLKHGDILVIEDHFKHDYLCGREVVLSKISPTAGYVLGNLIIHENNFVRLSEEATFRLSDICIKEQTWSDFHLRSKLEDIVESLHNQKEGVDSKLNLLTRDDTSYLSLKNESLTVQVVSVLKIALESNAQK